MHISDLTRVDHKRLWNLGNFGHRKNLFASKSHTNWFQIASILIAEIKSLCRGPSIDVLIVVWKMCASARAKTCQEQRKINGDLLPPNFLSLVSTVWLHFASPRMVRLSLLTDWLTGVDQQIHDMWMVNIPCADQKLWIWWNCFRHQCLMGGPGIIDWHTPMPIVD